MEQQALDFKAIKEKEEDRPRIEKPVPVVDKEPKIFTVSEIVKKVRAFLEATYSNIWVVGEVSNLRTSPSGHTYFSLKDDKALLDAALFKGFASKLKFQIKDGMEIVCRGNFSLYEKGGKFNLIVNHCEPKGVGALQLAFEQLKEKLAKEGLFEAKHKKAIPFLPGKIGVVTSPTGAVIRDIINVVSRRYPSVDILLYPVRVQGDGSAEEVVKAIEWMNSKENVDVLIVGRGGGSLEDLWAFNEEIVARAIFASNIPIISAVGHEIDFTIADFVADKRAPTPSAAAEIAVPNRSDLAKIVIEKKQQLLRGLRVLFEMKEKYLTQLKSLLKPPTSRFPDLMMQIDSMRERLNLAAKIYVERQRSRLEQFSAELSHLSPLAILSKGYSVVTRGKEVIKNAVSLKKGDSLRIRLHKGEVEAEVKEMSLRATAKQSSA